MDNFDIRESASHGQNSYNRGSNGNNATSSLQSIGAILRERRENKGVSLAEVEKATRIRQKYLAALEADEWHLLPGEVVGRGFLRNYANFLRMNANELMERRRTTTDGDLARALSKTSAGAALPPLRDVDYRPKDVDLEETPVGNQLSEYLAVGRDWFAPLISVVAVIVVAALLFWGVRTIGGEVSLLWNGLQRQASQMVNENSAASEQAQIEATNVAVLPEPTIEVAGVSAANGNSGNDDTGNPENVASGAQPSNAGVVPVPTDTPAMAIPTATPELPTATPTVELPTATPEIPTPTPEPPTPTPVPPTAVVELPTATPEPPTPTPAPVIVAANCPDANAAITSPGVNQVVSGVVPVTGSAFHPEMNFYKLEYAPGANAQGGYGYFDGTSNPVQGGVLGRFNSAAVPNGSYTLQLTVVDATGNYPPPCRVTIQVQN